VHRNSFSKRLSTLLNTWLPHSSDSESSSFSTDHVDLLSPSMNNLSSQISTANLKTMRQSSYDETLNNIRTNSSPDENRFVFDNLILLKREFKTHARKRNYDSIQSDDTTIVATSDENLPPPKKVCLSKRMLIERSNCSLVSENNVSPTSLPLDTNSLRLLKNEPTKTHANKRNYDSIQSDNTNIAVATDERLLLVQKACRYKQVFTESSNCSFASEKISRPPLLPIDTNRTLSTASTHRPPLLPLNMNRSPTEETSFSLRSSRRASRIAVGKQKKTERLQNKS